MGRCEAGNVVGVVLVVVEWGYSKCGVVVKLGLRSGCRVGEWLNKDGAEVEEWW